MKMLVRGLVVAAMALSMSCAMTKNAVDPGIPLQGSTTTPAGEGSVAATTNQDGNTALSVKVKHLAPASRIDENAQVYVVWVEPPNGMPQNVGALSLNDDREGTLNTLTPFKQFRVIITPEASATVQEPSGNEIFTGNVVQPR